LTVYISINKLEPSSAHLKTKEQVHAHTSLLQTLPNDHDIPCPTKLEVAELKPKALYEDCKMVYIDMGTNIGVQIRKLYEPSKYPGAGVLRIFDKYFGTTRNESKDLCAIGIEMNPSHTKRLKLLEKHYTGVCGYNVHIYTETAVAGYDGSIGFMSDNDFTFQEWGASTTSIFKDLHPGNKEHNVSAWDIAKFIMKEIVPYATTIVVKMDIEGAESSVLPRLVMTGAFCNIDEIVIEYHWTEFSEEQKKVVEIARGLHPEFVAAAGCKCQINHMDDESFFWDVETNITTC
jgi:hypothetical protein